MSPTPPRELGEFQMIRQACMRWPYSRTRVTVVGVDGGGVAGAMLQHGFAHLEGLFLVVGLQHGLDRSKLLHGQRLVLADFLALSGKDGGVFRNLEAGGLGDVLRGLARHHGVELRGLSGVSGAAEHVLLELGLLVSVHEIGLATLEFLDQRSVDCPCRR